MVGQKGDRNDILHGKMGRTSMAFRLTDRSMISDIVESQRVSGDEQGLTGESPHCSLRFPEPLAPHQVGANLCQLFALCPDSLLFAERPQPLSPSCRLPPLRHATTIDVQGRRATATALGNASPGLRRRGEPRAETDIEDSDVQVSPKLFEE
jgi:hypothetical protein